MARILLINDEKDLLDVCQIVLESVGHYAEKRYDPGTALETAKRMHPELIVLDMVMPEMPGTEVLRRLRAEQQTVGVPVLMISALAEGPELARELGADAFLAKPFDADELIGAVESLLSQTARATAART